MQELKSPEQEPGGPAPATRGRPLFSTRTSTLFPSVFSPSSSYFSPFHSSILHSLHVIFSFFFPIFLLLLLSTPYLTRNPPSSTSISFYPLGPTLTPIPSSSLSPCFTNFHFSLLSISFFPRLPSISCYTLLSSLHLPCCLVAPPCR